MAPPVSIVDAVVASSLDEHVLLTVSYWNGSGPPAAPVMDTDDVEDPVGPVFPCVLTVMGPDSKNTAGPNSAIPEGTVTVSEPPSAGSVTVGAGPSTSGGPGH